MTINWTALESGPLVLLGCGNMGGALLRGWLQAGAPAQRVIVVDPNPHPQMRAELEAQGVRFNPSSFEAAPVAVVVAIKPQIIDSVTTQIASLVGKTAMCVSIVAGKTLAYFNEHLHDGAAVVRVMPNTPASIGAGASALAANACVTPEQKALAQTLVESVGIGVWLEDEAQMDAVTALSGSGPAYVFHMIEAMAAAGEAQGLGPELAQKLARATVQGAGALAASVEKEAAQLRVEVTSPNGVTEAGLKVLMAQDDGLSALMTRTISAATKRSKEL